MSADEDVNILQVIAPHALLVTAIDRIVIRQ